MQKYILPLLRHTKLTNILASISSTISPYSYWTDIKNFKNQYFTKKKKNLSEY